MKFVERSEEDQRDFFKRSLNQFKKACQSSSEHKFYYRIGNKTFSLTFAGSSLCRLLTPALEHLRLHDCESADITFYVWDTETTGTVMPPPPCEWDAFTDRGDIWGFNSKKIRSAFHWSDYSVNLYDTEQRIGIYWVESLNSIPYWTTSAPLRTLFQWSLSQFGMQLIHAAAVGIESELVVITGKGGVGKSSTALACLNAGMDYIGDDYIIVENSKSPRAYSIYNTAKLFTSDKERFPLLSDLIGPQISENQEKGVYHLYPELSKQLITEGFIKAILVPNITSNQLNSTLAPIYKWQVEKAMAFTTISQLPGAGQDTSDYIRSLVEAVPCFEIKLSNDFDEIPLAISQSLKTVQNLDVTRTSVTSEKKPLISVIIPVYNASEFVLDAIESVAQQDYSPIEIIIVDDGSTDNLEEVLTRSAADVRYLYQENEGPSSARNRGIVNCSGSYIAFLDVDDYWPKHNLKNLLFELSSSEESMVVQGFGQVVKQFEDGSVEYLGNPKESFPFYIGPALYKKDVFSQVGLFDTSMNYGEDTDWYNRLIESGLEYKRLEQTSLYVRRHGKNMTEGKDLVDLGVLQVFKKKLERDRAKSKLTDKPYEKELSPLVSVIIPVFNGELFVAEAIESVLKQNYPNLEIIVVNDGSTDRTDEALSIFGNQIKVVKQPKCGVSAARNTGIASSRGDFIAFLDADDLWIKFKLKQQVDVITKSKDDIVVGLMKTTGLETNPQHVEDLDAKSVLSMNPGASLFRRSVFEVVGGFDDQLLNYEDVDWFFRAREKKVKIHIYNETHLIARSHAGSLRGTNFDKRNLLTAYKNSVLRRKSNNQAELPSLNLDVIMDKPV